MTILALAFAFQAATMPAAPPARPVPTPSPRSAAGMKAMGMSDAGLRVLQTIGAPDPDVRAFADRRAAVHAHVAALAEAQPFDAAAFLAALKDDGAVENEARLRRDGSIARTIELLPPADQPIFARAVLGRRGPPLPPPLTPR